MIMQFEIILNMTLNGTDQDLYNMLLVCKKYSDNSSDADAHFDSMEISANGKTIDMGDLSEENLMEYARNSRGKIEIEAFGPDDYNPYELNDINFFRLMAEAAPNAYFDGSLEVNGTYDEQTLHYELRNQKLEIDIWFQSNDDASDIYKDAILEKLTFEKFTEWFEIDSDEFDEESYEDMISEAYLYDFAYWQYADWEELLSNNDVEFSLNEEDFEKVKKKIESLQIKSFAEMQDDEEFGESESLVYDPIAKKYVDNTNFVSKKYEVIDTGVLVNDHSILVKYCGCEADVIIPIEDCSRDLQSITIQNSVTSIDKNTFKNFISLQSIISPNLLIDVFDTPAMKRQAVFGYLQNQDLFSDADIAEGYKKYAVVQRKKLLPVIFKNDMVTALAFYAEAKKITAKNFEEEYLNPAKEANAEACVAFLLDWQNKK